LRESGTRKVLTFLRMLTMPIRQLSALPRLALGQPLTILKIIKIHGDLPKSARMLGRNAGKSGAPPASAVEVGSRRSSFRL